MSIYSPSTQITSRYSGPIQANDNSRLHLGDIHYYGDQEKLKHVPGALFDAYGLGHQGCHPETRRELLAGIERWIDHPAGKGIFWLNGAAGTGKSTIAYTVADRLSRRGTADRAILGASFFFKRGEGEQASAALFFPTVIHELRQKIPGLRSLIDNVVQAYPDICNKSLSEQFRRLVQEPLSSLDISKQISRYIIVVDALDECENDDDVRLLLRLCSQMSLLGGGIFRMFLTSRPELPIRLGFSQMSADSHHDFILHTISEPVIEHDILVYLTDSFAQIRREYNLEPLSGTLLAETWPGLRVLQELTNLAVPLFIIAATICRFVHDQDWDPQEQLSIVLDSRRLGYKSHIAQTYLPILQRMTSPTSDAANQQQLYVEFTLIVGAIITLFEPLSRTGLASLLDLRPAAIATRLRSLHSVLSVPLDPCGLIRPLHLSFGEFLTSQEMQDQPFYVDSVAMHGVLATRCLTLLSQPSPIGLGENMCQLIFPGQARRDVSRAQIQAHFSLSMQYACRYWVHHFQQNQHRIYDHGEVHTFLQKHFLHWLEAMSLLDLLGEVVEQLWMLQSLVLSSQNAASVSVFVEDARRFVLASLHTIDIAPLQVYSSALVFAPQDSIVRQAYVETSSWVQRYPVIPTAWNALLQTLEGHLDSVRALSFSSDGSKLASASNDATVRIWDVRTGRTEHVLGGPKGAFSVVAFSPDGLILASGSGETVWLWDVKTGQLRDSLEGHRSLVLALSFSLDGMTLASASRDAIVRLWDVATGQLKQTFGQCEYGSSMDVAGFLPKGLTLAHGSGENIQLWNVRTGRTKVIPMGHSKKIIGVAFSPSGSILASVSDDMNVHLWDRRNSRIKHRLIGHEKVSSAVAVSVDASMLASASGNNTVWLWDAETGELKQKLDAHTKEVGVMTFSPKGSILASGSDDKTIRLWDVKSSRVEKMLKSHKSPILAVAFTPDGSAIVSASTDMTVQLWDTDTANLRHTSAVHDRTCTTVKFSPDVSLVALATSEGRIGLRSVREKFRGYTLGHTVAGSSLISLIGHSRRVYAMVFSPNNLLLASASDDGTIRLWDLKTHQHQTILDVVQDIDRFTFSADSKELLVDRWSMDVKGRRFVPRDHSREIDNYIIALKDEWVQYEGRNVLWLPHEYRSGVFAIRGNLIAIGCESGLLSLLRISLPPQIASRSR